MQLGTIEIARRFRGPPKSANGGYCCGRLASFIDGPAEVTLRSPPPLETSMNVVAEPGDVVSLYDSERLIATGRRCNGISTELTAPSYEDAVAASNRTFDRSFHKLPMCYVCGPDRDAGDGLRIFCGPLDAADQNWSGSVASPWSPEPYMATSGTLAAPEFVWASLDCPTAFACGSPAGFPTILLGRQAVSILRQPEISERCVIVAREIGQDGRKYRAEATLFGENADPIAHCHATWIEVPTAVQIGAEG